MGPSIFIDGDMAFPPGQERARGRGAMNMQLRFNGRRALPTPPLQKPPELASVRVRWASVTYDA
jgi:hypothetical protein